MELDRVILEEAVRSVQTSIGTLTMKNATIRALVAYAAKRTYAEFEIFH